MNKFEQFTRNVVHEAQFAAVLPAGVIAVSLVMGLDKWRAAREAETQVHDAYQAGDATEQDFLEKHYARLDAEEELTPQEEDMLQAEARKAAGLE